jgi:hypothetical protein
MKKKKKLKVKKFEYGGNTGFGDDNDGFGNDGDGFGGSSDTGPGGLSSNIGASYTGDSGIEGWGNTIAAAKELGLGMALPGAGLYTVYKGAKQTQAMRDEMGLPSKSSTPSTDDGTSDSNDIKPLPKLEPLTPEEKNPFKKMTFVRASKGSMVSTRGTKSIQVQGHKKTKLY